MSQRRKKQSRRTRLGSAPASMVKSKSAPDQRTTVEWPGSIDDKYVEDVRARLNVIEQNSVSDDMIRAFLAANDMKQRHAVESLKKTVEWRKGRQMFWNTYRTQNERFQFLCHTRICGKGRGSTHGHAKDGRLVFYEKIGVNFSLNLYREFSASEFCDHLVVWCENLLNLTLANCGQSTHLISEIPYYEKDEKCLDLRDRENSTGIAINDNETRVEEELCEEKEEKKKSKLSAEVDLNSNCKFSDCIGIIDWNGLKLETLMMNKEILVACGALLCTHYPHLINRLYHVNMPLNFEEIESELRNDLPQQIFTKSIFLESTGSKQKRIDYMIHKKKSTRRSNYNILKRKRSATDTRTRQEQEETTTTDIISADGICDEYAITELLKQISSSSLPCCYGGDLSDSDVFTYVDPIYTYLVGASAAAEDPTGYEPYDTDKENELASWTQQALRSSERLPVRIAVKRGQHYKWQYMAEYQRELFFGCTFEADGFRGKSIKVIVREEIQDKCGFCAMFGDFIVLKDGNLIFQFRNIKGGKRLNLLYKIHFDVFPDSFVRKYLPDYHAEERLLQTKTLNYGGKNHRAKSTKSPSEVSGSTAISTSPPPFMDNTHTIALNRPGAGTPKNKHHKNSLASPSSKIKRAKSQRHKKSSKKIKSKKKSFKQRAKTPEPPATPV